MRILHCPCAVGGHATALAAAERELGLQSVTLHASDCPNSFNYPMDRQLFPPGTWPPIRDYKRLRFFRRALREFDIFHFNFGQTLLSQSYGILDLTPFSWPERLAYYLYHWPFALLPDLPILRRAGKGIVVTFQGDDARQRDYCLAHFPIIHYRELPETPYSQSVDTGRRRRIAYFGRYAHRMYALNPDLLRVLPPQARFLPYANVDLRANRPELGTHTSRRVPRIIHAPTDQLVKGTRFILNAVERLRKADGLEFEFQLIEGLSQKDVWPLYREADLLIDQVLAGWYGGLAVELMALGKPVVAYLREEDMAFVPQAMRDSIPVISANPESIYAVLKELLTTRRPEWPEIGRRGRSYVERWHDPLQIAASLKKEYSNILGLSQSPAANP
jgi:glycosyltransferase involved in cell wall biosynthesis